MLFNIYTEPLGEIFKQYGLRYYQYADDTKLYLQYNNGAQGGREHLEFVPEEHNGLDEGKQGEP